MAKQGHFDPSTLVGFLVLFFETERKTKHFLPCSGGHIFQPNTWTRSETGVPTQAPPRLLLVDPASTFFKLKWKIPNVQFMF